MPSPVTVKLREGSLTALVAGGDQLQWGDDRSGGEDENVPDAETSDSDSDSDGDDTEAESVVTLWDWGRASPSTSDGDNCCFVEVSNRC